MRAAFCAGRASRRGALVLGLVLGLGGPLQAQGHAELERVLERVGSAWARGDVSALVAHACAEGVSLELNGGATGPLSNRKAAAALRRLFDDAETEGVRAGMAHIVGGSPARAFGEIAWVFRVDGTSQPERRRVFVALVQEDGAWRVTQIRLLR
ncbi:MAG TPA: hypothetical protein VMK65_12860 [Longimicrobiales bacterium]|nr:hypothetical protein [Longimicrobiales bacterium]